jgi:osmotically-inducible protein OsmY
MTAPDDRPEYLVAHITDALADRVGELGVHVTLTAAGVFLTGEVATAERQAQLTDVARDASGGRAVHNQTTLMDYPEPAGSEVVT